MNQIILGNCIDEMKKMPSDSVDLIFADPPYWMRVDGVLNRPNGSEFDGCNDDWDNSFNSNQDYNSFTKDWLSECKRILKQNGSIWVIGGMQCIYTIGSIMQDLGFWFINDVIWHKTNPTPNFMGTRLNNSHETLIWATKSKKSKFTFNYKTAKELNDENITIDLFDKGERKQLGSVWKMPVCTGSERLKDNNGDKLHSTQKPEKMLYRIIAISSKIGDTVLDPFGGTMTTATMAKKLGRNYISIEQNKKYMEYGLKRVEQTCFENNDIAKAVFDEKPLKVSLQEMIGDKFLISGEKLHLKNTSFSAFLTESGKLEYDGNIYDIHTLAALLKSVKAKRLNGFDYWLVERNGKQILLNNVRNEYREFRASA